MSGRHDLPVGHLVDLLITTSAAREQFGSDYIFGGRITRAAAPARQVLVVLTGDPAGRGWWVGYPPGRAVLVRPEDILATRDLGHAEPEAIDPTQEENGEECSL